MPKEVKPQSLFPGWNTYVPENSEPYHPREGDSWRTLAEYPGPKSLGLSANDLCYFNFKTRNPQEINWYLRFKVGCTLATHDHNNYMFSAGDKAPILRQSEDGTPFMGTDGRPIIVGRQNRPSLVYLPKLSAILPAHEYPPDKPRLDMWVGLGLKAGTMVAVAGIETLGSMVVSLDDFPHRWMNVDASINRLGAGWGVTAGACLVVITGVNGPADLHGHQEGDWDANVALGAKWDKIASATNKFKPLIEAITKVGAKTPKAFKAALTAEPDRYVDLIKAAKNLRDTLNTQLTEPKVYLVDIPWLGGGTEVSLFFGVANFEALWDSAG
jgi:hypothetical protein